MRLDSELMYSDDQAITGSADSQNSIDHIEADIGQGNPVYLSVVATEDFASSAEDETLEIEFEDSANDSDFDVVFSIAPKAFGIKAGDELARFPLPSGLRRYTQLRYVVAGTGNFTAGRVTAGLTSAMH